MVRAEPIPYLQMKQTQPNASSDWAEFETLYSKKMWHQLTVKILGFVKQPEVNSQEDLVMFYDQFLIDFEGRMNPLFLIEILVFVVKQKVARNPAEALTFLEGMKAKVKANQEAAILCAIEICRIKLELKDMPGVKEVLAEIAPLIEAETGVTPVHGRYFELSSDYHKRMGNHNEYYRDALRFLGCVKLESLDEKVLMDHALTLSLAALLGSEVYNFGELLQHPIIDYVKKQMNRVYELLYAFNTGNLAQFMRLRPEWTAQPDLAANEFHLRTKISLLCLMEMAFKSGNGVLRFEDIASEAQLPINEVEHLIMKALSKKLVRGKIDEVHKRVYFTWVQPRVMDRDQISGILNKINIWQEGVKEVHLELEGKAAEIVA